MSPDEIVAFWGRSRLRCYSPEAVCQAAIPQSSKDYLLNVGFPGGRIDAMSWNFDDEAFSLPRVPARSSYRRFGWDEHVPLCLDERRDGCVVEAETGPKPEGFMNSRVEHFGAFLTLWLELCQREEKRSDRECLRMLKVCERQMRRLDPAAFSDPENGWPEILGDQYCQFE